MKQWFQTTVWLAEELVQIFMELDQSIPSIECALFVGKDITTSGLKLDRVILIAPLLNAMSNNLGCLKL